jgi:ATP-dependent Clp protease ATP-binding subunit ClpA
MPVTLDPRCRVAVDCAKGALPREGVLDAGVLLRALYALPEVRDFYPALASALSPAPMSLADDIKPVLNRFAQMQTTISPRQLFAALLDSDAGKAFLRDLLGPAAGNLPPVPDLGGRTSTPERESLIQRLSGFGRMLTGPQPPPGAIVEMEGPLKVLFRTLCGRKTRNAIIVGPSGTGKTVLVYELARRLSLGDPEVPERLRHLDVFELSPAALRAGASLAGQYEARVKDLIAILRPNPRVVLFVDEIHSLIQSGVHTHGPFTEGNEAFKTALSHGEITLIGCTTNAEFRHYIEPDAALLQRFKVIKLDPPDAAVTVRILKARLPRVTEYYGVNVPELMIERVVQFADEYLPGRQQPAKSIRLLDDACALCETAEPAVAEVTEDALWQALEDTIGRSLTRTRHFTVEGVAGFLSERIVGQSVLTDIAKAVVGGFGEWRRRASPRAVFLFAGPTGVGKTETALLLAELLGGGKSNLIRVDCNTLQGSGYDSGPATNRLLGVPPGYVGYVRGQGGLLSRIRDLPEAVVLFDEIEKADPGVGKLLLQVLDEGMVDDVEGNRLDFRRAFIIFTTNAGCTYRRKRIPGFERESRRAFEPFVKREDLESQLSLAFGQEFVARLGPPYVFQPLTAEDVKQILLRQLEHLRKEARERGFELSWDEDVPPRLVDRWEPQFGVRQLTAGLRSRVEQELSIALGEGELKGVKAIQVKLTPGRVAASEIMRRERIGESLVIYAG